MSDKKNKEISCIPVKQLLNFVQKECNKYDISAIYNAILAIYGNDKRRLISLNFYIDSENKKDIIKFISQKGKESAIKKRMQMAIHSILTKKRNNDLYEIEYTVNHNGYTCYVGALKFHAQENTRIISREYNEDSCTSIVKVEGYKKKVEKNTGKYKNRLEAASRIQYYLIDEISKNKIFFK
ncbi:MAG: hypothetical protein A3F72_04140 [Bacteroidetes bacterium RIFCSPLOWO2_12_FULL_35_15]|nr:MAG: hypothetical protein A3F72_04140 [Bacteroidetes bacterium RIFCSPLOWO2_12_FULL_35_15]